MTFNIPIKITRNNVRTLRKIKNNKDVSYNKIYDLMKYKLIEYKNRIEEEVFLTELGLACLVKASAFYK